MNVRKIESSAGRAFYDVEFWGESDDETYGLLCFVQVSKPENLIVTEMNSHEFSIVDDKQALECVKRRLAAETGRDDLIFPKVIRFEEQKNDITANFQAYLKSYQAPIAVYEDIFDSSEEAFQVEKLSLGEFKKIGGKVALFGDLAERTPPYGLPRTFSLRTRNHDRSRNASATRAATTSAADGEHPQRQRRVDRERQGARATRRSVTRSCASFC